LALWAKNRKPQRAGAAVLPWIADGALNSMNLERREPTMKKTATKKESAKAQPATHPLEGKRAPDFELPDAAGHPVKLRELTAKGNLVIYFYPKDMTTGCTREACDFRDNLGRVQAAGGQVIGISADSPQSHQKFVAKHELNFPLLSDTDKRVLKAYGVYKKKSLYGREFMGIERTTFVVDRQGTIRKVFPKVRVDGHAGAVLDTLKALAGS
jgi:thioredoxin-dependent peroxiredoxin